MTTDAAIRVGQPAPDLEVKGWQLKASLSSLWTPRPLALVFLHDLQSPLASEVAIQWRDNGSAHIDAAGGVIATIACAEPAEAAAFRERWSLPFEVFSDLHLDAYDAFEVSPELPGSFVIDTGGVVRYAHRNAQPLDNPATWSLVDVISSITGMAVERPAPTPLEESDGDALAAPKPGQHALTYTCVKCGNQSYEVLDVSATSGMLSRMVNLQNRRFSAVVCQRCRYVEFYQTQSGALRNIADFIIGS